MSAPRAERLLALLQVLRRHRRPVTGAALAAELGTSLRTLYRDIASLQAQGADIEGEAGIGYVLRPGFMLPPMMFSQEEIEALALGIRWVGRCGDPGLARAADNALARIAAVLPAELRAEVDASTLLVGPAKATPGSIDTALLRAAIRDRDILHIAYADENGRTSDRCVWPFALGFFERVRVLVAWCELRQDFRHFRTDRIGTVEPAGRRYRTSRAALLKQWREQQKIKADM